MKTEDQQLYACVSSLLPWEVPFADLHLPHPPGTKWGQRKVLDHPMKEGIHGVGRGVYDSVSVTVCGV